MKPEPPGLKDSPPKRKIESQTSNTIEFFDRQDRWESCKDPGRSEDREDAPKPASLNYIQVDVKVNPKSNSKPIGHKVCY